MVITAFIATFDGNVDIMKILLEKGANPNISSLSRNRMRMKPLGVAAIFGRYEAMEILLRYGADVNADFDVEMGNSVTRQVTALDVVEMILGGIVLGDTKEEGETSLAMLENVMQKIEGEGEGQERFGKVMDVLVKHGAKRHGAFKTNDEHDEL
eukprot:CAMPEP_0172311300 /NCGR_PEP_ID=MMETSP1058-20130122/14589_1 /TAXON_ID=83371 /ORGANISM="Detonula confervacea, Strain CCMP 353" /LENGTH=153 /DNA_ID=CAMNT_0013024447 /DNA_START=241 /DNA_END=702 /DNA_ORIENTATION=+